MIEESIQSSSISQRLKSLLVIQSPPTRTNSSGNLSLTEPDLESIDLAGTRELLDRLELSLEFQVHEQESVPTMPTGFELVVELGDTGYCRSIDDSLWICDRVTGAVAYLVTGSAQLQLWQGSLVGGSGAFAPAIASPLENRRYFWHSFVRSAVAMYLSDRGYTPIHAAGLVDPAGQLWLVGGYTHAGKSTLTIGLLEAGWGYLGDDGLLLAEREVGVVAHSWWGDSLLDPILVASYPHLESYLGEWIGRRRSIDLRECYRSQWLEQKMPVRLAFPQLDGSEPLARLVRISPGMALAQLMQHSAPWLLKHPQPHLRRLQALCMQSEHFSLHLGVAARTQPDRVAEILMS
jgi:hypothetical protein